MPESWRVVLDAVPAAVVIVAPDGAICFANAALEALTGYRREKLAGRPVEVLVPDGRRRDHAGARRSYRAEPVRRPMGTGLDISCRRADGSVFPADISLSPLEIGGEVYVVATISDETERRRSADELFHRAVHDPLTGLANRTLLTDRLDHALAGTERKARQLAVLYVDLDGFKAVNDTWHHAVGDEVLRTVAERLSAAVRPDDTVARFGGDEFVVLCEDLAGAGAIRVAERILAEVSRPIRHRAGAAHLTASIGIVLAGRPTSGVALIEAADRAMYRAKRRGGNALEVGGRDVS
ncbi:MAG TPA: sensor domain-containing diguanylate cyclase [Acidimicrobiia bacterium]|nr:sensor domain-containing diguanylate cyclase [Acidimicrobiia bacterium]